LKKEVDEQKRCFLSCEDIYPRTTEAAALLSSNSLLIIKKRILENC